MIRLSIVYFDLEHLYTRTTCIHCIINIILQISEKLGELYSEMIFVHGYVHCDPHPGNVLVKNTPKGVQLVLLDHGLYQVNTSYPDHNDVFVC